MMNSILERNINSHSKVRGLQAELAAVKLAAISLLLATSKTTENVLQFSKFYRLTETTIWED